MLLVIYVDVLFVLNFFITYLLLLLTKLFNRKSVKLIRLLSASALGGAYALIILAPKLNCLLTLFGKLCASAVIVLTAFGFKKASCFVKNLAVFYFSNMLLLGVVMAVLLIFNLNGIAIKNDAVYFDISAKALILSGLLAYIVALVIVKIHNASIGKSEIYSLTICCDNEQVHMFAFADSGNKLKEPFSSYPVIIADKNKLPFESNRVIPFSTVAGEGGLKAFKPDKVIISFGKNKIETDRVYVAKADIDEKEYSAILNPEILKL